MLEVPEHALDAIAVPVSAEVAGKGFAPIDLGRMIVRMLRINRLARIASPL